MNSKKIFESDFKKDTKLENLFFVLTAHHFLFWLSWVNYGVHNPKEFSHLRLLDDNNNKKA